jgi:hypothetical protein
MSHEAAMLTIIRGLYRNGGAEERLAIRDVHIAYMIENRRWLEQGGALLSADGAVVEGMFLMLRHETREAVEVFLANEPYMRAGLFKSVTIDAFDRFVPHTDPHFLERLLASAQGQTSSELR